MTPTKKHFILETRRILSHSLPRSHCALQIPSVILCQVHPTFFLVLNLVQCHYWIFAHSCSILCSIELLVIFTVYSNKEPDDSSGSREFDAQKRLFGADDVVLQDKNSFID